jgi:hypothetical protein
MEARTVPVFREGERYQNSYLIEKVIPFFDGELAIAQYNSKRYYLQSALMLKPVPSHAIQQYLSLDHPLVIPYIDVFTEDEYLVFVRDYLPIRPLPRVIQEQGVSEEKFIQWAKQLVDLEDHLRDLHIPMYLQKDPRNIGVTSDGNLQVIFCGLRQITSYETTVDWGMFFVSLLCGYLPEGNLQQTINSLEVSKPLVRVIEKSLNSYQTNRIRSLLDRYENGIREETNNRLSSDFQTSSLLDLFMQQQKEPISRNRIGERDFDMLKVDFNFGIRGRERERNMPNLSSLEDVRKRYARLEQESLGNYRNQLLAQERDLLTNYKQELQRRQQELLEKQRLELERQEREQLRKLKEEYERKQREQLMETLIKQEQLAWEQRLNALIEKEKQAFEKRRQEMIERLNKRYAEKEKELLEKQKKQYQLRRKERIIEQSRELDYLFQDVQEEALSLDLEQFGTGLPEMEPEPTLNINTRSVRIESTDPSLFEQPEEKPPEEPTENKKDQKKKKKKSKFREMWSF